jgi:hypothetical protein
VLGRQRVGGVVAFYASTGANKEQFVMVIALAAHECDGIETIYFDDTPVTLAGEMVQTAPYASTVPVSASDTLTGDNSTVVFTVSDAPISGTVSAVQTIGSGETQGTQLLPVVSVVGTTVTLGIAPAATTFEISYQHSVTTSYARVRQFLGAPGQTVESVVQSLFPTQWDSAHPMSGCAGLAVFFNYNEDAFPAGLPAVSAVMRGAKVYDPRLDTTAGGSGPQRANDSTTWAWSENPALLIRHYALHQLGGRLPAGSVNDVQVAVAANVCDEQVDYSTWGNAVDENGVPLTDESGAQLQI